MKMKKKYLFPAVLACAFVLLQSSFSLAGTKNDVDEELSPYKWGHWDRMVPPAAGPVALAPAPVTAVLPSPDPIVPPDPPIVPLSRVPRETDFGHVQVPDQNIEIQPDFGTDLGTAQ